MHIILFLNRDNRILTAVNSVCLKNHRIVTLGNPRFFRHYVEEYIPGYVIMSADSDDLEKMIEFSGDYQDMELVVTCNNKAEVDPGRLAFMSDHGILLLDNIRDPGAYIKVLMTIDDIGSFKDTGGTSVLESVKTEEAIQYINQQVVSVFSIQGGIGRTTIAANIAFFLGKTEKIKALLIDLNFAEGPCDLSLRMKLPQYPNLSTFLDGIGNNYKALEESVLKISGINMDVLIPANSLYQNDRLDIELLNSLIYTARSIYNYIIIDIPNRFDSVFLEMLNLSTVVLFVTGPQPQQVLKPQEYLKFLPGGQKHGLVINNVNEVKGLDTSEIGTVAGIPVFGTIPLIRQTEMTFLKIGRDNTDIIDLQSRLIDLINSIILT